MSEKKPESISKVKTTMGDNTPVNRQDGIIFTLGYRVWLLEKKIDQLLKITKRASSTLLERTFRDREAAESMMVELGSLVDKLKN